MPAVVGTGNVTALLHTGQIVSVDGGPGLCCRSKPAEAGFPAE
ncbi:hypothetical protein [Parafrigoribacterium mesophilum]